MFGIEYALGDTASLGLKGRWLRWSAVEGEAFPWDPLRSHVPNLRRDLSEPVVGYFTAGEMELLGLGLTLTYRFGR